MFLARLLHLVCRLLLEKKSSRPCMSHKSFSLIYHFLKSAFEVYHVQRAERKKLTENGTFHLKGIVQEPVFLMQSLKLEAFLCKLKQLPLVGMRWTLYY